MKLNIQCVSLNVNRHNSVTALSWFSGKTPTNRPVLAICYDSGKVQIMIDENDEGKLFITKKKVEFFVIKCVSFLKNFFSTHYLKHQYAYK